MNPQLRSLIMAMVKRGDEWPYSDYRARHDSGLVFWLGVSAGFFHCDPLSSINVGQMPWWFKFIIRRRLLRIQKQRQKIEAAEHNAHIPATAIDKLTAYLVNKEK